jgi:hypothetical protein
MICAFVGALGAGKSYSMVELGLRYLSQGYRVYSVTHDIQYADPVDIDHIPKLISLSADGKQDSVLLMDEAGLLLFSRDWARKDTSPLIQFVITSRKRGFHIFYTAQYKAMVDKVLREVTTDVVYCMKLPFGFGARFYHPSLDVELYRYSPHIWRLYDTTSGYRRRGVSFVQAVDEGIRRSLSALHARLALRGRPVDFTPRIVGADLEGTAHDNK